jgi:hypothetical protein
LAALRPEYVFGLEQALYVLPSSWHRKLTPPWLSVKLKLALVWFVGFAGVAVMDGAGGAVVSIDQAKLAALLWLPAASWAITENV